MSAPKNRPTSVLLSADDRAALASAFHCMCNHCGRWDEGHNRAKVVLHRLAGLPR